MSAEGVVTTEGKAPDAAASVEAKAAATEAKAPVVATDGKAESETPKDGQKPDEGKQQGAPEKYEAFKMPDGLEVDPAVMDQFSNVAKELGLKQEQAQKLVDFQTAREKSLADSWSATAKEWQEAAKNDKEFGGEKLTENLAVMKSAVDKFAGPEAEKLMEALSITGAGNHPEVLRFFTRVGKAIANDEIHRGATTGEAAPKSTAEKFYGATTPA